MTKRFLNIAKAMALVMIIPIMALAISSMVSQSYNEEFLTGLREYAKQNQLAMPPEALPSYRDLCASHNPEDAEMCMPAIQLEIFEVAALVSLGVGAGLFILLLIGRMFAGPDRERLALVLPPMTRLMLIGLSVSIILQGALFVFGIFIAESVFFNRVHIVALAGIGLAALVGGINLIQISFKIMQEVTSSFSGLLIDEATGADLIKIVHEVADQVGARRPDNIVVGLEPNFFVTGAKVTLYPDEVALTDSTLYMPVPFLRILTIDELRSVIGHEMGHFIGKDTEYSLKFYPAYSRLESAIQSLIDHEGRTEWVNFPTLSFLVLLHDEFSGVERKIGREREITADQIGAGVGSPKSLATALLKFSEYAQLWNQVRETNVSSLNQGEFHKDLNQLYFDICKKAFGEMNFPERKADLLSFEMAHPSDTHPTLSERLTALGLSSDGFSKEDMVPSGNDIAAVLPGYGSIADKLTKTEHRLMIGMGFADPPSDAALREG